MLNRQHDTSSLTIHQFLQTDQSVGSPQMHRRQVCMRRRPRLKKDVRLRATFFGRVPCGRQKGPQRVSFKLAATTRRTHQARKGLLFEVPYRRYNSGGSQCSTGHWRRWVARCRPSLLSNLKPSVPGSAPTFSHESMAVSTVLRRSSRLCTPRSR